MNSTDNFSAPINLNFFPYFIRHKILKTTKGHKSLKITGIDAYDGTNVKNKRAITSSSGWVDESDALNSTGEFQLAMSDDSKVLKRDINTDVFVVLSYMIG